MYIIRFYNMSNNKDGYWSENHPWEQVDANRATRVNRKESHSIMSTLHKLGYVSVRLEPAEVGG